MRFGSYIWVWDPRRDIAAAILGPHHALSLDAADGEESLAHQAMRGRGMRLAILRHDQKQPPPLVRDAGLRQPRQGSGGPATAETGSKRLIAGGEVASSQSATTAPPAAPCNSCSFLSSTSGLRESRLRGDAIYLQQLILVVSTHPPNLPCAWRGGGRGHLSVQSR